MQKKIRKWLLEEGLKVSEVVDQRTRFKWVTSGAEYQGIHVLQWKREKDSISVMARIKIPDLYLERMKSMKWRQRNKFFEYLSTFLISKEIYRHWIKSGADVVGIQIWKDIYYDGIKKESFFTLIRQIHFASTFILFSLDINFGLTKLTYTTSNPELLIAARKAIKEKKVLVILQDVEDGEITRIGYYVDDELNPLDDKKAKWIERDEIELSDIEEEKAIAKTPLIGADLELTVELPKIGKTTERIFLIHLIPQNLRFRNIFRETKEHKLTSFVIQLEAFITKGTTSNWKEIIRCDCSHGFVHYDLYYSNGKKEKIKVLEIANLESGITYALDDLKKNLSRWLIDLGYTELNNKLPNWTNLSRDLEDAKRFLLDLIKSPEKASKIQSIFLYKALEGEIQQL